jgi:hypothetical protein
MPGERVGRVYVPSEDHVSGWRWSRKRGAGPGAPAHLIEHARQLSVFEMYQLDVEVVQVGGLEHAKVELRICPRCHARRRALYSFGGRVGCRGKDCLDLHYATSHTLRRADVDIERIRELMRRAGAAKSRKMRAHWEQRALAAYEAFTQRQTQRRERREVALGLTLSALEDAAAEYLREHL